MNYDWFSEGIFRHNFPSAWGSLELSLQPGHLKILHCVAVLGNHFGHFCNAAAAALQVLCQGWHEHHTAQQHSHKESQSHVQRCVC